MKMLSLYLAVAITLNLSHPLWTMEGSSSAVKEEFKSIVCGGKQFDMPRGKWEQSPVLMKIEEYAKSGSDALLFLNTSHLPWLESLIRIKDFSLAGLKKALGDYSNEELREIIKAADFLDIPSVITVGLSELKNSLADPAISYKERLKRAKIISSKIVPNQKLQSEFAKLFMNDGLTLLSPYFKAEIVEKAKKYSILSSALYSLRCMSDGRIRVAGENEGNSVTIFTLDGDKVIRKDHAISSQIGSLEWNPAGSALAVGIRGKLVILELQGDAIVEQRVNLKDDEVHYNLSWKKWGKYDRIVGSLGVNGNSLIEVLLDDYYHHVRQPSARRDWDIGCLALNHEGTDLADVGNLNIVRISGISFMSRCTMGYEKKSRANCIEWSPDNKIVSVGRDNGTVSLEPISTAFEETFLPGNSGFSAVVWHKSGGYLAAGDAKGVIWIWKIKYPEMEAGRIACEFVQKVKAHKGFVKQMAWLNDAEIVSLSSAGDLNIILISFSVNGYKKSFCALPLKQIAFLQEIMLRKQKDKNWDCQDNPKLVEKVKEIAHNISKES